MVIAPVYKSGFTRLSSQTHGSLSRDRLKAMLAAAPRLELEQATLRLLIGAIVLAYLAWHGLRGGVVEPEQNEDLAVAAGFVVFSTLLTLTIIAFPRASAVRRLLGLAVDIAVTTYCLIRMGERGAVVFFVYLFITFGASFRYGKVYLHACQLMSIGGLVTVFWLSPSPFWRQHPWIGGAFLLSLIVLPLYVGALADRIKAERVKAEQALKECVEREQRRS